MPTISKINGIAIGNIAKINGIAKANIAKVDGISIITGAWVTPTAIHSYCHQAPPYYASNTIDSDTGTKWHCTYGEEHWIIFDLGETKNVKKVQLYISYAPENWDVCEVSAVYINDTADESGGSKGSGVMSGGGGGWREIDVTDTNGRYVKIKLKTYYAGVCGITAAMDRFYEFQAYV